MSMQMLTAVPTVSGTQTGVVYQKTVGTTGDSIFFRNSLTQEVNISRKMYFWYLDGDAETGTNVSAQLFIYSEGNIRVARAYASTAPTGAALQIDIQYLGTSIWTSTANQVILAAGSTSTSVATFAQTSVTAGGLFKLDIDTIGATAAGGNVTVMVEVG